ncbi:endonuclease [Streptomyces sp. NBC_01142]|uniref:endonuclease n=1 Tax=Streptomyces sp. NBC_01142 TaxID=2975865 RepID=UPI00225536E9|nr:endonuclease [Streptomyces sp. NBC_01142]MCX4821211.1 endonuclease [Streptomyces sp. NBC_01142]
MGDRDVVAALLDSQGRSFAQEAGIRLRDTPQPLYQLLVLARLLSRRIRSSTAVETARALNGAGLRTPRRMREATWQQRVDALGRGGYRRYDESTATQLGDGAQLVMDEWGGDLRRLRAEAAGDVASLRRLLQKVPGIGPTGADIFLREVQDLWSEAAPYLDEKALQGARSLGLPDKPSRLARYAGESGAAVFAAALVRAALDKKVADACLRRAETEHTPEGRTE